MSRHTPRTKLTALLVLAMLGGAGIAFAQTATVKSRDPGPSDPRPGPATATVKARDPGAPDPIPVPGSATAAVKTRDPSPPKPVPVPAPATTTVSAGAPTAGVDLYEIGRRYEATFAPGFPADVNVWADKVDTGGYTVIRKESLVYVRVANRSDRSTAPAGTYKLRVKLSNVAEDATLLIQANGTTQKCSFKRLQGYMNIQPCDVTFTTKGAALDARISYTQGPSGLTLHSIEVSKIR